MMPRFDLTNQLSDLPDSGVILVAVLNWGIGHATRCIPLIKQLQNKDYQIIIASDGDALLLLKQVFPKQQFVSLPSYRVSYARQEKFFSLKMLWQMPKFIQTYWKERKTTKRLIKNHDISGIISDNRFGIFFTGITSIYITHQLKVKSGILTRLTSAIHQYIIGKYDVCWVPDVSQSPNLTGELSHDISLQKPVHYIGILSQFSKQILPKQFDILVLLSGPEPQRSLLEKKLITQFRSTNKSICFVQGKMGKSVVKTQMGAIICYNYLLHEDLEILINQSELIIARSGYSTIMDLAVLQKKAFFIPTPGQSEQMYLAEHLEKQGIAPFSFQKDFTLRMLEKVTDYTGFLA